MRRNEKSALGIEWLIELGVYAVGPPKLQIGTPFRAERIQPSLAITGEQIEISIATEVTG